MFRFGINERNSLSEPLLKKKGENCSKCHRWADTDYCPIKPIAMIEMSEQTPHYESSG